MGTERPSGVPVLGKRGSNRTSQELSPASAAHPGPPGARPAAPRPWEGSSGCTTQGRPGSPTHTAMRAAPGARAQEVPAPAPAPAENPWDTQAQPGVCGGAGRDGAQSCPEAGGRQVTRERRTRSGRLCQRVANARGRPLFHPAGVLTRAQETQICKS